MKYRGNEFSGAGITVAVIDSGVNASDPRLRDAQVEGWNLNFQGTGHALIGSRFDDEHGHGTEIAVAVHGIAPAARIVAIRITDPTLVTNADLMAAGIETAFRHGAQVINLSMGTPNMGKALLLRDVCAMAVERGTVVVAAAHQKVDRTYPADLPEVVGVTSHPDCPPEKMFYFAPHRFPFKEWRALSGKFLTHGYMPSVGGSAERVWRGSGIATAYISARVACLREALPDKDPNGIVEVLRQLALTPVPEIGYA
jgi:subtilisin family serine protease